MHLADGFIQSDSYCIQGTFYQFMHVQGENPIAFVLLAPWTTWILSINSIIIIEVRIQPYLFLRLNKTLKGFKYKQANMIQIKHKLAYDAFNFMSGRHYMLVCKTVLISVRHRNIQLKKATTCQDFSSNFSQIFFQSR